MNIELHLFTNGILGLSTCEMIKTTYSSFCEIFNINIKPTVWFNPSWYGSNLYYSNLKKIFPVVNLTSSLSDGYISAIETSSSNFLFMLEHDWEFLPTITHSLTDICSLMENDNLMHLRFNKRANIPMMWDKSLHEVESDIKYCLSPSLSNNPHIIKKDLYMESAFPCIRRMSGSRGIEERLTVNSLFKGAIYGPLNYKQTIRHLDGRKWEKNFFLPYFHVGWANKK